MHNNVRQILNVWLLLLYSRSPNDVPLEPQRNVSIAAVRGAVRPSSKCMAMLSQCIFDFWKNSRTRNKQMFTNARAFSRVSYFLYFFCFSHMFCGKKVVVVFLWNHIHMCMPLFFFFYFHRNIKHCFLSFSFVFVSWILQEVSIL